MTIKGSATIGPAPVVTPGGGGGGGGGGIPCGASDTFSRTVVDGWGTSDVGFAWTSFGTITQPSYVDGTRGVLTSNGYSDWVGESAMIPQLYGVDFDFSVVFQANHQLDSGTLAPSWTIGTDLGEYISIQSEFTDPWIELGVASGVPYLALTNNTHLSYIAGLDYTQPVKVRVKYTQSTRIMQAKAWQLSGTEPTTWLVSDVMGIDATGYYLVSMVASKTSNGIGEPQLVVYVDDFSIVGLDQCSTWIFDTFQRTVSNGWGSTDTGQTWLINSDQPPGYAAQNAQAYSVAGGYGKINPELSQGNGTPWPGLDYGADCQLSLVSAIPASSIVEFWATFRFSNTATQGWLSAEPQFYRSTSTINWWGGVDVWANFAEPDSAIDPIAYGTDQSGDTIWMNLGAYFTYNTSYSVHGKMTGGRVETSIWKTATQVEPAAFMAQEGDATYTFSGAIRDTFYIFVPNVGQSVWFENITIKMTATA